MPLSLYAVRVARAVLGLCLQAQASLRRFVFSCTSKRLERSASPPRAKFRVARCKARLWFGLRATKWPALALVRPEVPERCKLRCKLERKVGAKGSERGRIRDNKNQRDGEKQSIS